MPPTKEKRKRFQKKTLTFDGRVLRPQKDPGIWAYSGVTLNNKQDGNLHRFSHLYVIMSADPHAMKIGQPGDIELL